MNWPFDDATTTAVFTSSRILGGKDWIYYVTHDADDGAWQFHPYGGHTTEEDARVTGLQEILEIEPRICELADLPKGWHAWRSEKEEAWERAPQGAE